MRGFDLAEHYFFDHSHRGYTDTRWNTRQVSAARSCCQNEMITLDELGDRFEAVVGQLRESQDGVYCGGLI